MNVHRSPLLELLVVALAAVGPHAGALAAQVPSVAAPEPVMPTLGELVRRALDVHPSVAAADATVEAAEAVLRGTRASRLPSLGIESTIVRHEEPMVVAPLHGFDPTRPPDFDPTLLQGAVGLDWTLFDGGARSARAAAAGLRTGAAREERSGSVADLLEATTLAVVALETAARVVEARERFVEALQAELERAGRLVAEGSAAPLERMRAEAELSRALAEGEAARAERDLAVTRLARILDLDPALVATWRPRGLHARGGVDVVAPTPPPEVAAAHLRAEAAERDEAAARATRLPRVRGLAGWQVFAGGDTEAVAEWRAGLAVSYPLFTGGGRGAAIDEAAARASAARARADLVEERARLEADAARTDTRRAAAEVEARSRALERFVELERVERLALDEGAGVQSDWLRARAGVLEARAALDRARAALVAGRVREARVAGVLTLEWIEANLEEES